MKWSMTWKLSAAVVAVLAALVVWWVVGIGREPSPDGAATTQVGGTYVPGRFGLRTYRGGKWIEVLYGRPIKRGRDLFGSGDSYGKALRAGAPVWRAGANVSTRLDTEAPLVVNGTTIAPGRYTLFIDLKPGGWTFVVSRWRAQTRWEPNFSVGLWGAFGYTPEKDVVRAPMIIEPLPFSVDELTWSFLDMTRTGGRLAILWDTTMASIPFTVAS